jgi:hypothetical protein
MPLVMHRIRLINRTRTPLTTAPAMILRDGRLIAQGMMTFTAPGAESDLTLTTAVEVANQRTETEVKRTPGAATWDGSSYERVDFKGSIALVNRTPNDIEIEVVRTILGTVDVTDERARHRKINGLEEPEGFPGVEWRQPNDLPAWWSHFNGVSRITWSLKIPARKDAKLTYGWHYFHR